MKKDRTAERGEAIACTPEGLNAFRPRLIHENLDHLLGEILTIVDASIVDGTQRTAIKDLVKDKFSKKHDWFSELAFMEVDNSQVVTYGDAMYSIVRLSQEQLRK
jgi:hypothetical protein